MKLSELQPRWLINDGARRLFIFKNPTGGDALLTCKNFKMSQHEQRELVYNQVAPELRGRPVVFTDAECAWSIMGGFDNLTVKPSIDASASGNWHGYITDGDIR